MQSKLLGPCGERFGFSIERDHVRIPLVSRLFCARRPLAVVGLISLVVVTSLQCVLTGWPAPKVRQKVGESILAEPAITHDDSSPTVVFEVRAGWVGGAFTHLRPHYIFRSLFSAIKTRSSGPASVLCASTAMALPIAQDVSANVFDGSAFALTGPVKQSINCRCRVQNDQPSECLTSQISAIPGWLSLELLGFNAATTLAHPRFESSGPHEFFCAAVTATHPSPVRASGRNEADHCPAIKPDAGKVFWSSHADKYIRFYTNRQS